MRARITVEADIAETRAKLRALCDEWRRARKAEADIIGREFDAGFSIPAIANEHGISEAAVRCKLWRSGRTSKGRTAISEQLERAQA